MKIAILAFILEIFPEGLQTPSTAIGSVLTSSSYFYETKNINERNLKSWAKFLI